MNVSKRGTCSIPGCDAPHKSRGWCRLHYERWQRTGSPIPPTSIDRLMAKIEKLETGCWEWCGAFTSNGYGRHHMDGRHWMAHRAAYVLLVGPIADGMQLDHLCRNRRCVNPQHLEQVTPRENTLRSSSHVALNAAKTHCHRGHEFTPENTIRKSDGRACRTCAREHWAKHRAKKRAQRSKASA